MRYEAYIVSPEWVARRSRYFLDHPRRCAACGGTEDVQLHHLEYAGHRGTEPDSDLLPLCIEHHDGAHAFHSEHSDSLTLRAATARYVASQGGQAPPEGNPKPPPRNHDTWSQQITAACPTCTAQPGEACVKVNSLGHSVKIRGVHKARKTASARLAS